MACIAADGALSHIGCGGWPTAQEDALTPAHATTAGCGGSEWLQPIKLKASAPMTSALTLSLP
jgi:hypothetical protein